MPNRKMIAGRQSYCIYRRHCHPQSHQTSRASVANGFSSLGVFLFVGVVMTGVLYLFSMNEAAIQGDVMYTMEKEIAALARENEQLVVQEAQLTSLENVERTVQERGMQEITTATYIEKDHRIALTQQ